MKSTPEIVHKRVDFYREQLRELYRAIGADVSKIEFIKGSDFELGKEYTMDMYRLAALSSFERAKHAAAEVVKFGENPKLSGFLYPILQTLDEEYLEADTAERTNAKSSALLESHTPK
jgi:tyrosyl-tRNA synthetase